MVGMTFISICHFEPKREISIKNRFHLTPDSYQNGMTFTPYCHFEPKREISIKKRFLLAVGMT